MPGELVDLLGQSKLFAGFTPDQLEQAVLHLKPRVVELENGEIVYKKGAPADRCWIIRSGKLTVRRASLRSPFRSMIYHRGSVTGIQGLADPGSERPVTMIADGKVKLIEITHAGVAQLDTEAQIHFWQNVSRLLLRKLAVCLSQESFDR